MTAESEKDESQPSQVTDEGQEDPPTRGNKPVEPLLASPRRRESIRQLIELGGEADIGDLAEKVAAQEEELPVEDMSTDTRKRVYISLYQVHLPRLDEEGLIEFDKEAGRVVLTELGRSGYVDFVGDSHSRFDLKQYSSLLPRYLYAAFLLLVLTSSLVLFTGQEAYARLSVYATPLFILGMLASTILEKAQAGGQ